MNILEIEKKIRGRPRKEIDREHFVGVRLTDEEYHKLLHITIETDLSNSEVIRNALRVYYNLFKNGL